MPQYCLVKHHIVSSVIDGPDVGNEPDTLPVSGDVTFYPILDRGDSVVVTAGAEKVSHILAPISARIVNGKIFVNGGEGVKLFAGGPDTNPSRIRYRAKFTGLNVYGGKQIDLKDVLFEAIPGGELTLSMAQPVPGAPYPGYSATIEQGLAKIEGARDEALGQVEDSVAAEVGGLLRAISGPNLLNLDGATPETTLRVDGTLAPIPTRTTTDFIPVEGATRYVWSVDGVPISGQQIIHLAYTADKTVIGGHRVSPSFETTSTTRFLRASILNEFVDKAQLEEGTVPTEYVAHGALRATDLTLTGAGSVKGKLDDMDQSTTALTERVEGVEALAEHTASLFSESKNVLNLEGSHPGKSWGVDETLHTNPTRTATDFIPVEGSTDYVWSYDGTPLPPEAAIYQAFNADREPIHGRRNLASFDTTSTTRFLRASILNEFVDKAQLEEGTVPTEYVVYGGIKAQDITLSGAGSVKSRLDSLEEPSAELAERLESVEALVESVGTLAERTSSLIQESKNLLNLEGSHPGKVWSDIDEALRPNPTRTATDFIPVDGSTSYVWSADGVPLPSEASIHQAFNADKVKIGGRRTSASFATTSATRFIRASILTEFIDKAQLEKGTDPTPYVPYGGVTIPGLVVGSDTSVSAMLADLMDRVSTLEGAPPTPTPTPGGGLTPQSLLTWELLPHPGRMLATAYDGNTYFDTRVDGITRMVKSADSGTTITPGMKAVDTPGGSNGTVGAVVWEDGSIVRLGFDGRIYRADAFDAEPRLVYQTTTGNTLHAIANSSYSDGAGKRYIFAGEYDHTPSQKSIFYSRDGGDTWDVLLQGGTLNDGNNHWHSVTYDPYRDAVWVSEGDGLNSKVGVTFDWGATWEWVPQNHPTSMHALPDRVVMGRDKSGIPPGISESDGTSPLTITDALTFRAEDRGSFHFYPLRPSWNQWNDTYYILFPARHEDDTDSYIWATGDGGDSWHLVSNGPVPQLSLTGIDSHGYLFAGTGGGNTDPLYRAKAVTWI